MSDHLLDVIKALLIVGIPAAAGIGWRMWLTNHRREAKLDQIIRVFEGHDADPLTGLAADPGLLAQVQSIKEQLLRNGGVTLRDAIARIELSTIDMRTSHTESARRQAVVEHLLRQHIGASRGLIAVARTNDDMVRAALRAAGITVPDPLPLPEFTDPPDGPS